jgi:hypothetical protein
MNLQQLKKKPRRDLIPIAASLGLTVREGWNRDKLAEEIVKADALKPGADPEPKPDIPAPPTDEFDKLTAAAAEPKPEPEPKDSRGGFRPGAGRPDGLTDLKARIENLPKRADAWMVAALKALFNLWSIKVGIDKVALTEEEALEIALPFSQIVAFHFPQFQETILHVYIGAAWTAWNVVLAKVRIIKEAKGWNKTETVRDKLSLGEP